MRNPVLGKSVARAIELARLDRERLASSAPQLFQHTAGTWDYEQEEDLFAKVSLGVAGATTQNPFSGATFNAPSAGYQPQGGAETYGNLSSGLTGGETPYKPNQNYQQLAAKQSTASRQSSTNNLQQDEEGQSKTLAERYSYESATDGGGSNKAYENQVAENATINPNGASAGAPPSTSTATTQMEGASGPSSSEFSGSPASSDKQASISAISSSNQSGSSAYKGTGKKEAKKSGIGILRLVPLQVSQGNVAIVEAKNNSRGQEFIPISENISMSGQPSEWMPKLLSSLQQYAASWGIAGEGMYWKSKIVLHVDELSGEQAKQLAQYLRQSGVEIHRIDVANGGGASSAKIR